VVPRIRKVSEEPVAGATFVNGIKGEPSMRYIERDSGHWYETPVNALTLVRLTNTTVPGVHDALWVNASTSIMRFLAEDESVENFVALYAATTTDQELKGAYIDPYARIAVGADGTIIGALAGQNGSAIETFKVDGKKKVTRYTSPLTSWVPHTAHGAHYVVSAPAAGVLSSVYEVVNNELERVFGDVPGLSVLFAQVGPDILYSSGGRNAVALYVYDGALGERRELPLATLAEKCAWAPAPRAVLCGVPTAIPAGDYPDDWLLGRVHTSDSLWFIDTETGQTQALVDLEEQVGVPLDVGQLQVSSDGQYALFINKNDQTLWSVALGSL
jgi:hypothetical protein